MINDVLIRGVDVLGCESDGCRVLRDRDILVRCNRISAVRPSDGLEEEEARQVIPGAGLLAMPGLINTHAHVPMGIFRGLAEDMDITTWFNEYLWPLESNLEAEDVYWGMQLGLAEMIEAGVTSVADHYFHMDRAAEAVDKAGTRAALGWAVFGNQGAAGVKRTASFAEEYDGAGGGRITTWLAPHAPTPATRPSSHRLRARPRASTWVSTSTPRRPPGRPAPAWRPTARRRSRCWPTPAYSIGPPSWPTAAGSHPRTSI